MVAIGREIKMGTKHLRDAFNKVAQPTYTCSMALMDTQRAHDVEASILTFIGTKDTGEKFTVSSRPVKQDEDVNAVVAETAQALIGEENTA